MVVDGGQLHPARVTAFLALPPLPCRTAVRPLSALRVGLGGCGLYPFAAPYRGEVVNIPNLFFDQNYQIAPTGSDPSTRLPGGRDQATNCAALRFA